MRLFGLAQNRLREIKAVCMNHPQRTITFIPRSRTTILAPAADTPQASSGPSGRPRNEVCRLLEREIHCFRSCIGIPHQIKEYLLPPTEKIRSRESDVNLPSFHFPHNFRECSPPPLPCNIEILYVISLR